MPWPPAGRSCAGVVERGAFASRPPLRTRSPLLQVHRPAAAADLRVVIDSGPRLRFGALRINGLERYEARLVENLSTFREGEPYSFEALVRLRSFNLDKFLKWDSKFVNDLVIAEGHALRAIKLLGPDNPDLAQ